MSDESNLDDFFPPRPATDEAPAAEPLGIVMAGSLSKGLDVKLAGQRLIEGLAVGRYVVSHGQGQQCFCLMHPFQPKAIVF